MQDMVDIGLIIEELSISTQMCQIQVKVTGSRYVPSRYNEVKHYAKFSGCRSYI